MSNNDTKEKLTSLLCWEKIYNILPNEYKKKFIDSSKYISHRGPDNNKSFFHRDINLIFYRLRIRDLTIYGDQPMFSYSKKLILRY